MRLIRGLIGISKKQRPCIHKASGEGRGIFASRRATVRSQDHMRDRIVAGRPNHLPARRRLPHHRQTQSHPTMLQREAP